jgi:peptidyl-prolyl cis-trans isomerase SurA
MTAPRPFAGLKLCLPLRAQSTAQRNSLPSTAPTPTPSAPTPAPAAGAPLDRVVAIVNSDLILDSDVDQEQRFEALQPFHEEHASTRSAIIERLIDRDLILQQAALQPDDAVTDADVTSEIDTLRKNLPACSHNACATPSQWQQFLSGHGFTPQSFFHQWQQRMQVLAFIEQRFRMGTRITPQEIKTYYQQTLLPEYAQRNAPAPSLDALSDRIQQILLERRVSSLLDDWLRSLRAQGSVVVLHPGEEAP